MNFKQATDRIAAACVTHADVADAAGVSENTIRRARMDPESKDSRRPPKDWPTVLAQLARDRAAELEVLAVELETEATE